MLKTESTIDIKLNEDLKLLHVTDLHDGNTTCKKDEWKRMLDTYGPQRSVFAFTGDMWDLITLQDARLQLSQLGGMEEGGFIDDYIDAMIDNFIEKDWLPFGISSDRVLFWGIGNHEWQYIKRTGHNPAKNFCRKTGITYGGYSGFHILKLKEAGRGAINCNIYYHHGYGAGSRSGGYPITKYEKEMIHHEADIFMFGHDHNKRHLLEYPWLSPSRYGEHIYPLNRILSIGGTFMVTKPHSEYAGYAEMKAFPPSGMGYNPIKMRIVGKYMEPGKENSKRRYLELRVHD